MITPLGGLRRADLDQLVDDAATLRNKAWRLYSADEVSIADLLDAYNVAEQAQLARVDAIEEIVNARLDLMLAAGTQFNAALDRACGHGRQRAPQ